MKGQVPIFFIVFPFIVMGALGLPEDILGFSNVEKSLIIALHSA